MEILKGDGVQIIFNNGKTSDFFEAMNKSVTTIDIETSFCPWAWKARSCLTLLLAMIVIAGFSLQICAQTESVASENTSDRVVLQLKWTHQFNFAGYYAAVEKGFYKEAGFEVTIKEGQPGMDFINEVVSGRAHYGVEMPELLIARHSGKPVVVLAAIFQHSPQILLARADSGIKSPHDLIGKKVMWRHDSAAELRAMLINENVPFEHIEFMELSWDLNDLIIGKVDAIHAYINDQPLALEKAQIESQALFPITYGIDFYGDCLFTSEQELAEHPERVKAFRAASLRGWTYAMEHPEELMDIISGKYGSKSARADMRYEFEHINQLMLPKLVEIGHMNPGRWKHIGDTFVKLEMLDPEYSLEGFLYDPTPQPDYTNVKKIVGIMLSVITVISIITIILFVFNRKLTREVLQRTRHLSVEIEERKRTEREISRRKAEFEAIFNSISDAVVFVDTDRRLMMVNPAFTRIFGYQLEEIVGKTSDFFYADSEKFREQGKKRYNKGVEITQPVYEMEYQRKDGTVFPAETLGAHVKSPDGEVMGFIGVMRDITERKQSQKEKKDLETHLLQAHKMEAIGTMAGGIAHDFNNMLSIIIGNAEIAMIKTDNDDLGRDNIGQIIKASHRAKDMVKQILAFTRQTDEKTEALNINRATEDSLKLLRATIPTSIEVRRKFELDTGVIVVDPTQFHQLMINLCNNATQAMYDKGILEVGLTEANPIDDDAVKQFGKESGSYICLSVSDTGEGIAPAAIDRIFDPFYTTKKVGQGTGMGLSVVHGIVESSGGFITVDSVVGKGTTFRIYFPKADEMIIAETKVTETLPSGKERILFVDDEEALIKIGKKILELQGYSVTTFTSSIAALNIFESQPDDFDLIITDMAMPDLTGKELAVELLKIRPDMPIILFTGYSSMISKESAEEIGISEYCLKPYDSKQLATTVRKVLDKNA